VQPFPGFSTADDCTLPRARCGVERTDRRVANQCASRSLALSCQHFLKQGAVFFDVLVYSGCSAFRFPNARSDQAISLH
jgi:hypothetical protein